MIKTVIWVLAILVVYFMYISLKKDQLLRAELAKRVRLQVDLANQLATTAGATITTDGVGDSNQPTTEETADSTEVVPS
jgi:hypothetical protein